MALMESKAESWLERPGALYGRLVLGVFFCSTAVIFIKASELDPVLLAGYRQWFAAVALLPLFWARRALWRPEMWRRCVVPGILLGLHFISWIVGARLTPAANASLIVNLVPVAMPIFMFLVVREVINRGEVIGTLLAIVGVVLLTAADFSFDQQYFVGDVVCFGSMLLYAGYLTYGKVNRDFPSIWLYVVPVYGIGGLFCLLLGGIGWLFGWVDPSLGSAPMREIGLLVGLTLIPTVLGHSTMNWAMQKMRGQLVAIVNLGQFIFAGVMGWLLLQELPTPAFYPACVLLVAGAIIAIRAQASAMSTGAGRNAPVGMGAGDKPSRQSHERNAAE